MVRESVETGSGGFWRKMRRNEKVVTNLLGVLLCKIRRIRIDARSIKGSGGGGGGGVKG